MSNQHDHFAGPGPYQAYQDALDGGEFRIQQCNGCGKHVFYPRALCKFCGSPDLKWIVPTGNAVVYSTSIIRQRPEKGPDYNVALVDLEEGARMMTRIVDIAPEEVKIGMPVQGFVGEIDGQPAFVFRPAAGGDN